jgi:hypothetical protein
LSIHFCPILTVHGTLDDPRLQPCTYDCVISRGYAHFMEIPANPLTWRVP